MRKVAIVRNYDPRRGVTYVYESKKYYDRTLHKAKNKRRLIGKLDPITGEVVPTGKRGRPPKKPVDGTQDGPDYQALYESYLKDNKLKDQRIEELSRAFNKEREKRKQLERTLRKISRLSQSSPQDEDEDDDCEGSDD